MATSITAKTIEQEIAAAEARVDILQTQREIELERIKYLKGLQKFYGPPPVKREPLSKRDKSEEEKPSAAPLAAEREASIDRDTSPPSISPTVMSVDRPPGPAATSIPSDGPVRAPTTEQMRGSR